MERKKLENKTPEIDINQMKMELLDYIKTQVDYESKEAAKRLNDRYIREKKRKIFFLWVIIFILLFGYLITTVFLIKDHYFDKYIVKVEEKLVDKDKQNKEDHKDKEETDKPEEKNDISEEIKKQELINKYSNIFDGFKITKGNSYLNDFYHNENKNLVLLSLGAEYLTKEDFEQDGDIYILKDNVLASKIETFTKNSFEHETFTYNNIEFKYIKTLNCYFINKEFDTNKEEVKRVIVSVKEDDTLEITTKEYYIKDKYIIDPTTDIKLMKESSFDKNNNKLQEKTYRFKKVDDKYYMDI